MRKLNAFFDEETGIIVVQKGPLFHTINPETGKLVALPGGLKTIDGAFVVARQIMGLVSWLKK